LVVGVGVEEDINAQNLLAISVFVRLNLLSLFTRDVGVP
jgi:hypothetical protein